MNPIKQAIEALLYVRDCSYIDDNGSTALMKIYDPEHVDAALAALRSMPQGEPYAYAVYFPDQPTEELVHDLDELCEDMTNREHTITPLFATPPTAPVPLSDAEIAEACKGVLCVHPNAQTTRDIARAIERAVLGRGEKA